jgi:hypothetical protein
MFASLIDVTPNLTKNDERYKALVNAVFKCELFLCAERVCGSYFSHHHTCKFRETLSFSSCLPAPLISVSGIIGSIPFQKMKRIDAGGCVTRMSNYLVRPAAMCEEKRHSGSYKSLSLKTDYPVPFNRHCERPKQTLIGLVGFNRQFQPSVMGTSRLSIMGFSYCGKPCGCHNVGIVGRLGLHRCSSKASVLGRGRFGERLGSFSIPRSTESEAA